ncbi:hypothetical protein HDV06_003232 [Boothiomyces sp. JEL0866]|nr:hypothetical protein HDV06_003232 [Boothiomyces sp. JEL0866]
MFLRVVPTLGLAVSSSALILQITVVKPILKSIEERIQRIEHSMNLTPVEKAEIQSIQKILQPLNS